MARGLESETVTKDSRRPLDRDGADHAVTLVWWFYGGCLRSSGGHTEEGAKFDEKKITWCQRRTSCRIYVRCFMKVSILPQILKPF
jgi:hypothetical protein